MIAFNKRNEHDDDDGYNDDDVMMIMWRVFCSRQEAALSRGGLLCHRTVPSRRQRARSQAAGRTRRQTSASITARPPRKFHFRSLD